MAAATIFSPNTEANMASRRQPLANVPNAINSPFRATQPSNGKRTRAQTGDGPYGQPAAKKQIVEIKIEDEENVDPRRRAAVTVISNEKGEEPFAKRTSTGPPTAFEKRLASVREKKTPAQQHTQRIEKSARPKDENIEGVRQWQRHYRRLFPHFVFYFDNVPDNTRVDCSRLVHTLGSREEKFFSNKVTHVVTTRQIPPELANTSADDEQTSKRDDTQVKSAGVTALSQDQRRTTSLLDANLQRRTQTQPTHVAIDNEARRGQTHASDILTKARELNIKIWALEKLQRMLNTMYTVETGDEAPTQELRPNAATITRTSTRTAAKDADLEQMLRNEKITGPADRDMTVAGQDMNTFRGCYIYIHDMDERTKPVMIRDYPKPTTRETGKWPQFRLTAIGRCPFVEDLAHTKRLHDQERRATQDARAQQEIAAARRTRGTPTLEAQPRALTERQANLRRSPRKVAAVDDLAKPLDPPKVIPAKRQLEGATEEPPLFGSAQVKHRGLPRTIRGEPIASGMQHSNVTSAIRSQAISSNISSTAPGLTRRLADSKEVSALKRKVLDRGATANSNQSVPSSYMNDMRAAINDDQGPPPRAAKRRAQETLGVVHEDDDSGRPQAKPRKTAPKKKAAEKEPKPGYCENCRDKFDDFDEHVVSRKHRKFACTGENWKELDALLVQLKRPHKDH